MQCQGAGLTSSDDEGASFPFSSETWYPILKVMGHVLSNYYVEIPSDRLAVVPSNFFLFP
jgi:hypothetical protein